MAIGSSVFLLAIIVLVQIKRLNESACASFGRETAPRQNDAIKKRVSNSIKLLKPVDLDEHVTGQRRG